MPDSIFDLKQTLFTSNLPVPTPRDRGPEKVNDFDQALNSAQRQNRDEHRANNTPVTTPANNNRAEDPEPADDAPQDKHDEVTLSQHASGTAPAKPAEQIKGKKTKSEEAKSEEQKEPTAEEIAAAIAAPQAPAKPVLKQLSQGETEQGEKHEGIELNHAVQPGGKQRSLKPTDKKQLAATVPTDALPANQEDVTAATTEPTATDPNAVVVATELHSTKLTNEKKFETKGNNKAGSEKAGASEQKRANEETEVATEGEHREGAFAISVATEKNDEAPAPKRRVETTQQKMPEVHEGKLPLATPFTVTTEANASVAETAAPENTVKPPEIPAISTTSAETPTPPNHLRGPQIPGSFANRFEAAANERKSTDALNGVDRTRFVQRVARAFQRVGETEGEIRLRLSPPELGAVKLEVSLRDGAMVARMETETTTARNLLMDNLPQLKERLAEQNVRIETFEVEVRDQSRQDSAEDAKEQLRQQQDQQRNRLRGERATAPVVAAPIVQTLSAARQSSQLNIII